MAQHSPSFSALSPLLQEQAERQWQRLIELAPDYGVLPEPIRHTLLTLLGLSDFVADSLFKQPELLTELLASGDLERAERWPAYQSDLSALLAEVSDEEALKRILRQFRRSRMLVIAWRELLGHAEVEESFIHLTKLADALICSARDWLYTKQCGELGTPMDGNGNPQPLLILGMGKLGGGELNFSSDIDLIFSFPENGETQGGRRALDNQTFFIRLGQQLINALHQTTADGQVFRVDMRLRPFGDAGPLAVSFAAMEDYYQHHGRSWERYAMVKARVLGPKTAAGEELQQLLRPFIYRRYIDFGAIDALRKMKGMIEAEVRRKGLKDNIKLGAGGIREVEFIAQVYQLIRGGRERALQIRHLPAVLAELGRSGALAQSSVDGLQEGYRFLRRVEYILQEIGDQQTQTLPESERDRLRLVTALGYADWSCFYHELQQVMALVRREFIAVIGDAEAEQDDVPQIWHDLWQTNLTLEETTPLLLAVCPQEGEALAAALVTFRADCHRRSIGPQGREALNRLMPALLLAIAGHEAPATLFARVQTLLSQIMTRSAYLQLLVENRGVLNQLLQLCAASEVVAKQLALAKLPPEDAADALALAICHIHNHARLALADVKQL